MPAQFDSRRIGDDFGVFFESIKTRYVDVIDPTHLEVVQPLEHSSVVKLDLIIGTEIAAFLNARCTYPVFTEETIQPGTMPTSDYYWLVDPIDGTREFIKAIPECVSSIALIERVTGAVVYAAIFNLFKGELYLSDRWNPKPTVVSIPLTLLASRNELAKQSNGNFSNFPDLFLPVLPMGSIANKLLHVALEPEQFAVLSLVGKNLWDVAGAIGFAKQRADVRITDLDGAPIDFLGRLDRRLNGVIGCHVDIWENVFEKVQRVRLAKT